jgi:hypothetical protein
MRVSQLRLLPISRETTRIRRRFGRAVNCPCIQGAENQAIRGTRDQWGTLIDYPAASIKAQNSAAIGPRLLRFHRARLVCEPVFEFAEFF